MSALGKTTKTSGNVPCVWFRQGVDIFFAILLGYAGWEGKDRGILIPCLVIGAMYAFLYFKTNRVIGKSLERMRNRLLAKQPSSIVSKFFAYIVPLYLQLVSCYFLFLFLVWQTILYYEKNFKF